MSIKSKGLIVLFCFGSSVLFKPAAAQENQSKPNIIFILADDLGYGDIGVFFQNQRRQANDPSKPFELTPHIDQLAVNGAQLTQQYCNAPVCAPSRASLVTGVNQGNAHVRDNQFDKALENNHTLATVMKQAGYATIAVGKWGLQGVKEEGPYWPAHPLKRGFDHYFGYIRHKDGHEHYPAEGVYRGKKEVWEDYTNVAAGLAKCYTTDLWTAYAKKWIVEHESKSADQPFFMYLAYDAPHAVLELPTQAYPAGGGLKGGMQWLNTPGHMISTASGTVDSYVYPEYANALYDNDKDPSTAAVAWPDTYKRYATATRRVDDAVGDVMQLLKDLHIDNNTLVVFTSDNGPSIESYLPSGFEPNHPTFFDSYGPFDGIKRDCWEGGVRMPTLVTWPGHIKAGKVVSTPSMFSDWLPTFADAAHLPAPAKSDGVSLLPVLTGKGKQQKPLVYVEYFEGGKTPGFKEFEASRRDRRRNQMQLIRMNNLAGVRYNIQTADDDFEIYDVIKDPKQTTNLASRPGFDKVQAQMKAKVLQVRRADLGAKRPYDEALIAAVAGPKKLRSGLELKFFRGDFPYVIEPARLKPAQSGTTTSINQTAATNGQFVYQGFINIPEDGCYEFAFQSSQRAFVRLHEATLFDADYDYTAETPLSEIRYLKKGLHPIRILAHNSAGQQNELRFQWKKQGDAKWLAPDQASFFH